MADIDSIKLSIREIERYGNRLIEVIEAISEEQLWSTRNGIPNSIGTLARHLTGNLNNYFGAGISKNGYKRNRDREFTEVGLPKITVISELRAAIEIAKQSITNINQEKINLPYKAPFEEEYESLAYHILRLATHFSLHVGQAEYTQSILNKG
jgi:predicted nuclease of restriction endonuclease-like RecB superfamily